MGSSPEKCMYIDVCILFIPFQGIQDLNIVNSKLKIFHLVIQPYSIDEDKEAQREDECKGIF